MTTSPIAVYIDHGLRPGEVQKEIKQVVSLAERFDLPHRIIRVNVKKYKEEHKTSFEEAARILRYEALEKCRQEYKAAAIAVAHTADDQTEEILLRLIRGTGLKGLSGMQFQSGNIIRPLLQEYKQDLIRYLQDSQIPYCYDSSNSQIDILRNRVRLELIPLLQRNFNTSIQTNLLQTGDILQQDEELLNTITEQHFTDVLQPAIEQGGATTCHTSHLLDIKRFLQCHKAIRRRIIEKACWQLTVRPSYRQIVQVSKLIKQGQNGAELHLPRGLRILRNGNFIHFTWPCGKESFRGCHYQKPIQPVVIDSLGTFLLKDIDNKLSLKVTQHKPDSMQQECLVVDGDTISFPLVLRPAAPGERFIPQGMKNSKKVTRFLSDQKIPRQLRHLYPVLVSEKTIVAVAGLRINQHYAITEKTTNFLQIIWSL